MQRGEVSSSTSPLDSSGIAAEFVQGWPLVVGSVLGIAIGVVGLPSLAIGLSLTQLQAEFSWTRTQISLGPTIIVTTLALTAPWIGAAADRIRAVWIVAFSLCALALSFVLMSRLGPDVRLYYATCAGLAFLASGASTLVYARLISGAFRRARGLALGIAMIGNGLTSALLPLFMTPYLLAHGWRSGFAALAGLIVLSLPILILLLRRDRPSAVPTPSSSSVAAVASGMGFREALGMPLTWSMVLCFMLITLAAAGINFHFIAFLQDAGATPVRVGTMAGLIGVSLITSRLLTGWLLDRFVAPLVAACMMVLSAAGLAALAAGGAAWAPLGAAAIGLSIGSEIDLIGFFTARYFGMRAYGRIYGIQYSACLVGGAISPLAYGRVVDLTGSYALALWGGAAMLIACAMLFWRMGSAESLDGRSGRRPT